METAPIAAVAAAAPAGQAAAQETMRSSEVPEKFSVEEFFDFSNEDDDGLLFSDNIVDAKSFVADSSSSVTLLVDNNSSNSSICGFGLSNLTSELCVPYDDPAELDWVSTFAEESFSSEDMEKLQFISGMSAPTRPEDTISASHEPRPDLHSTKTRPEPPVPGKARSKRARTSSGNWTSPLLLASGTETESAPNPNPNLIKKPKTVRKYGTDYLVIDGRKCQHCQTEKTPQWRTGPRGPKTLCNACGVRYKTGRLVPEYRPASSPTFVQTKHSNSHRKVMELRRQKEIMSMGTHQQNQRYLEQYRNTWMDGSGLIHRLMDFEPDFGRLI